MATECGAYSAIIDPKLPDYNNPDLSVDITELVPQVAAPPRPDNIGDVNEFTGIRVDQVFLGSCTNGRLEDFELAASIVKNRRIASTVRFYICPASKRQLELALNKYYIQQLIEAGAILLNPSCSLCFGSCQGIMDEGEVLFSTGNRNYAGRVGHIKSLIYLGSPATAAATALLGKITDPRLFL